MEWFIKYVSAEKVAYCRFFQQSLILTPDLTAILGKILYVPPKPKPAEI